MLSTKLRHKFFSCKLNLQLACDCRTKNITVLTNPANPCDMAPWPWYALTQKKKKKRQKVALEPVRPCGQRGLVPSLQRTPLAVCFSAPAPPAACRDPELSVALTPGSNMTKTGRTQDKNRERTDKEIMSTKLVIPLHEQ